MAIFSPNSTKSNQNDINFAHPSIDKLKDKPVIITPAPACRIGSDSCDSTGILNFSKNIFHNIFPKSSLAPNSARLNKDLKIGNIECIRLNQIIEENQNQLAFSSLSEIPLPEFDQGGSPNCQLIASLTAIQKSVDFPIDWGQFFKCLPISVNINDNKEISSSQKEYFRWLLSYIEPGDGARIQHMKLFNALFSGRCLSISPAPEGITNCANGKFPVSTTQGEGGSNDGCSTTCNPDTIGIRLRPIILEGDVNSGRHLCFLFKLYGPRPMAMQGNDYIKMELTMMGSISWDNLKGLSDREVRELLIRELIQREGLSRQDAQFKSGLIAFGSHAVTLIGCQGPDASGAYKFTIRNSVENSKDIEITWKDSSDLSIDKIILPEWMTHIGGVKNPFLDDVYKRSEEMRKYLYNNIVYKVESCESSIRIIPSEDCKKQNCKDLGYDSDDPHASDSDCPCKCIQSTNNINRLIQRVYNKNSTKCQCPKDPLVICGPDYDSKTQILVLTQQVDKCDCECVDSKRTYPCSGGDGQSLKNIESLKSTYNIVTLEDIKITY